MLNIGGVCIGRNLPCRFVAEISNNHNGSLERAFRLIDVAKAAGADFVKFQCYSAEELVALRGDGPAPEPWGSQGWTMRTLYEQAATPFAWFPALFAHARNVGIVPFSSVFGEASLAVLRACDCPAYKIARLDNRQAWLVHLAQMPGAPILVSYGREDPPAAGSSILRPHLSLYCPPNYPTAPEDVALPRFDSLGLPRFDALDGRPFDGLSSHCLHHDLPIAAVARGATLIEMHLMLREEPSHLEATVSLDQYAFASMIARVRQVEAMLA